MATPLAHVVGWTGIWAAALAWLSFAAIGDRASSGEWIGATYGLVLSAEDLTPNLGVFWYFFTEIFEKFRLFFLFVFHYFPFVLGVPGRIVQLPESRTNRLSIDARVSDDHDT